MTDMLLLGVGSTITPLGGNNPTTAILAENSDFLMTEGSDYLVQE